jgi:hypothetical protein
LPMPWVINDAAEKGTKVADENGGDARGAHGELEQVSKPMSWHQTVITFCLEDRTSHSCLVRLGSFLILVAMMFTQIVTLLAITRSLDDWGKDCDDSNDCAIGFYCVPPPHKNMCLPCAFPPVFCNATAVANAVKLPPSEDLRKLYDDYGSFLANFGGAPAGSVLSFEHHGGSVLGHIQYGAGHAERENFMATIPVTEVPYMCAGCQKMVTGYVTPYGQPAAKIESMRWFDMVTLVMLSWVISLTVWHECEDIKLAAFRLWSFGRSWKSWRLWRSELGVWCLLIGTLQVLRHFLLVPLMLTTVPLFVLTTGSDALNLCLSA